MPSFSGGPLDGMLGYSQEAGDPPPDVLAQMAMQGGPQGQGGGGQEELPASAKFDRILTDARALAASDGEFSEEDKLILEQITSLLQKLKAKGEKDVQAAIGGRMSPAVGKAYAGAGG